MNRQAATTGYYASIIAFIAVIAYAIVQLLQIGGAISYPLDDRLIYGSSLAIAPPFLLTILALYHTASPGRRFWAHAALLWALIYTVYVVLMYSVQLATVIPLSLHNPAGNILTVSPHSFFWTLDALGYICMGISTFFASLIFKKERQHRLLQIFLMANGLMTPIIAMVYFYPHFSVGLLLLGSPWIITASGSLFLLSIFFRSAARLPALDIAGRY